MSVISHQFTLVKTDQLRRAPVSSGIVSFPSTKITNHDYTVSASSTLNLLGLAYAAVRIHGTLDVVLVIGGVDTASITVTDQFISLPFACGLKFTNPSSDTAARVTGVVANA